MKITLKNIHGKIRTKNCRKYIINWNKIERSQFQTKVKNILFDYINGHIVFSEFPVFGTQMKIDIFDYSKMIAYEIQGRQHSQYIKHFAKNRIGYLNQIKRDVEKHKFCEINNIELIEIYDEDLPFLSIKYFKEKFGVDIT